MARLIGIFILIGVIQSFAMDSYSQATKLTLKQWNTELEKVLKEIESKSEFLFLYNKDLIDVEQKVSVDVADADINIILSSILEGKNIRYDVFDRQVVLSRNTEQSQQVSTIDNAMQQASLSGHVTDSDGEPLPGVTVVVKGTTKGTVTNADGNYTLTDVP